MSYGIKNLEVGIDPTSDQPQGTLRSFPTLALKFILTGKTASGQTQTLAKIADSLVLDFDGTQFIKASAHFFSVQNRTELGDVDTPTGDANATERVVWYVPFFHPEMPQVIDVPPQTYNYAFNFNLSDFQTLYAGQTGSDAPQIDVKQVTADHLEESYTPYTLADNVDVPASGAGRSQTYNERNIVKMWFREVGSANLTDLSITRNNDTVASNQDIQGYEDEMRLLSAFAQDEATPDFTMWNALDSLRNKSYRSSKTGFEFDSDASGSLDVVRQRIEGPRNAQLSEERIAAARRQSIAV